MGLRRVVGLLAVHRVVPVSPTHAVHRMKHGAVQEIAGIRPGKLRVDDALAGWRCNPARPEFGIH